MTLYLIRHAQADERGPQNSPKYPDDSQRPLVAKGHRQVEALAKALNVLDIELDRLFSSPYKRALETAQPLLKNAKTEVETLSELSDSRYPQLLAQLVDNLEKGGDNGVSGDLYIALVGHEPFLSELTSYLLTGDETRVAIKISKAMVVQLDGTLSAGGMTLRMMLPARMYRRIVEK